MSPKHEKPKYSPQAIEAFPDDDGMGGSDDSTRIAWSRQIFDRGRDSVVIEPDEVEVATYEAWAAFGLERGWAGPPVCSTHDGIPSTEEEDIAFEEGSDPCIHIIRMYDSPETKKAVEENHSPSVWRQPS